MLNLTKFCSKKHKLLRISVLNFSCKKLKTLITSIRNKTLFLLRCVTAMLSLNEYCDKKLKLFKQHSSIWLKLLVRPQKFAKSNVESEDIFNKKPRIFRKAILILTKRFSKTTKIFWTKILNLTNFLVKNLTFCKQQRWFWPHFFRK